MHNQEYRRAPFIFRKKANDLLGSVQLSNVPETKVLEGLPLGITSDHTSWGYSLMVAGQDRWDNKCTKVQKIQWPNQDKIEQTDGRKKWEKLSLHFPRQPTLTIHQSKRPSIQQISKLMLSYGNKLFTLQMEGFFWICKTMRWFNIMSGQILE